MSKEKEQVQKTDPTIREKKKSRKGKSIRYAEESIKEIVGTLRPNALFVTM